MNALERLLQDDLDRLVDRLAVTTRAGSLAECCDRHPELRTRLEMAEGQLSAVRDELLRGYGAWRQALDGCGDVWAMASLAADEPVDASRRAA
jgi:hypothetical protein